MIPIEPNDDERLSALFRRASIPDVPAGGCISVGRGCGAVVRVVAGRVVRRGRVVAGAPGPGGPGAGAAPAARPPGGRRGAGVRAAGPRGVGLDVLVGEAVVIPQVFV